jgi:hypothetical protein
VVDDLHLDAIEIFQNEDGSRVASRWLALLDQTSDAATSGPG